MVNVVELQQRNKELLTKIEELVKENQEQKRELEDRDFLNLISRVKKWMEKEGNTNEYYLVEGDEKLYYGSRHERTNNLGTFKYVQELIRATQYLDKRKIHYMLEKGRVEDKNRRLEEDSHRQHKKIETLEKDLEEKELFIENLETRLQEEEEKSSCHLAALSTAEQWKFKQTAHKLISLNLVRTWQIESQSATIKDNEKLYNVKTKDLENQLSDKTREMEEERSKSERSNKAIADQKVKIKELEQRLEEEIEKQQKANQTILSERLEKKELKSQLYLVQNQLHLTEKELPDLPKKQSKFKLFGGKIKTKLQQFKQLIKEKKDQKRELICKVEVRSK